MAEQKTIMAIGGHVGDMELTAGGVLATMALKGYKIVTVALTGGERGNPAHLTVAQYREQKVREAKEFAEMLGGVSVVWDCPDCELSVNDENRFKLCDEIRRYKPDILLTHWKGSIHKDHIATQQLVFDAQLLAGLPSVERELPAHFARDLYYCENWEDPNGYVPQIYMGVSDEGFELWDKAISCHWFVTGSKDFKYKEYYTHLMCVRGIEARMTRAQSFMREPMDLRVIKTDF
jgi:LmbE family N-acetylglucosaminyl deacetylase